MSGPPLAIDTKVIAAIDELNPNFSLNMLIASPKYLSAMCPLH